MPRPAFIDGLHCATLTLLNVDTVRHARACPSRQAMRVTVLSQGSL